MDIITILAKPFSYLSRDASEHFKWLLRECHVALVHKSNVYAARRRYRNASQLKLNIGSGSFLKHGFLNIDFSPAADLRLDLRQPIPLPSNACTLIFSEHFVEHLRYPEETSAFAADCFRMLEPGGMISISVPDTRWPLLEYARDGVEWLKACEDNHWHPAECTTYMEHINFHFRQRSVGMSDNDFECHRFAYDFDTMRKLLTQQGFEDVSERAFDPNLDSDHRKGGLFVQARKPGPS